MDEGEKLSKKQLELESSLKKRNARIRELEALQEKLTLQLSMEASKYEQLAMEKSDLARNLKLVDEMHRGDLDAVKTKYQAMLKEATEAQVMQKKWWLEESYSTMSSVQYLTVSEAHAEIVGHVVCWMHKTRTARMAGIMREMYCSTSGVSKVCC